MTLCEVKVEVGNSPYMVRIGKESLSWIGVQLRDLDIPLTRRVIVVADANVVDHHSEKVMLSLDQAGFEPILWKVPSGEGSKSIGQLEPILSFMAKHRIDRSGAVIALGGGVTGDLAGFVAAIYLRGIALIQAPTTLLAMVDSSVGGKTGVNLREGKNLVGSFHQPSLVVVDLITLQTLPPRELAAGMAEVIKHGCIADRKLFDKVAAGQTEDLAPIIQRNVEIKAEVVKIDPFETNGRRATLNFGHTLGHAIENAAGYGSLLHGEAVAIGMRAAAHLSKKKCGLSGEEVGAIEAAIKVNNLPLTASGISRETIRAAMKLDKKAKSGVNRWVLLPKIGQTVLREDIKSEDVEELLDLVLT